MIELSRKLNELGFAIHEESDSIFCLNLNKDDMNSLTVKLVVSKPINERIHGPKNNSAVTAIGYFKFQHKNSEPDFYIFAFTNKSNNKIEFVIVPLTELENRLFRRKCITDMNQEAELRFWLLPNKMVFDTTNLSTEGEWYFIGGRMAENTYWDYTHFLNRWEQLKNGLQIC